MTKSTVTTKVSAAFLATVLVAGIIAISSPSFMTGAQAQEYYGIDSYKKKSNAKDVSVKNIKCNNINVNVNGLELNLSSSPVLSGLLGSEAQASSDEGERGASSYGSNGGGSYGDKRSDSGGDFKFVCINNNNNTVVGANGTDGDGDGNGNGNGEPETCLDCFRALSVELQAAIDTFLDEQGAIPLGPIGVAIPANVDNIAGLCAFLDLLDATGIPLTLTEAQIDAFITAFIAQLEDPIVDAQAQLDALILCLIDVGVLVEADVD